MRSVPPYRIHLAMNRTVLASALLIAALAVAGCGKPTVAEATAKPAPTPAASGPRAALPKLGAAPAWKLQDLNGAPIGAEQLKGKVVVIDFWATWCPPCRAEIPGYVELQKKYGPQGLVIVGVSLDQAGPDVVKPFATKMAINYPLAMGDEEIQKAFGGIEALPTTFLIDRDGQIRDRKIGAEETEVYEKKIVAVLAEGAKKS